MLTAKQARFFILLTVIVAALLAIYLWNPPPPDAALLQKSAASPGEQTPVAPEFEAQNSRALVGETEATGTLLKSEFVPAEQSPDMASPWPTVVAQLGEPIDPSRWATVGGLTRTPVPDSVFDAKYPANTEKGLLLGNSILLTKEVGKLIVDRSMAQFESGDYEDVIIPLEKNTDNEDGMRLDFYVTPENSQFPRWALRTQGANPAAGKVKIAFLRFSDHPDIYDKLDEANYLRKRLGQSP
jgi:hypothetical protein